MNIYLYYPDNSDFDGDPHEKTLQVFTETLLLKKKYQILYTLREMEEELNNSDGIIIIKDDGEFEFRNFTQNELDKISLLFDKGKKAGYFE